MREILPRLLWTGNAFDGRDLKNVLDHDIEAIMDVAMEEPPVSAPRELVYCRFPLLWNDVVKLVETLRTEP